MMMAMMIRIYDDVMECTTCTLNSLPLLFFFFWGKSWNVLMQFFKEKKCKENGK